MAIIFIHYHKMKKLSKKVFLKLLQSTSQTEFPQNLQASWEMLGDSFCEEQLVGYSSQLTLQLLVQLCSTWSLSRFPDVLHRAGAFFPLSHFWCLY